MKTIIHSNGSKWAGQEPDSIEKLIEVLGEHTIEENFFTTYESGVGGLGVARQYCPVKVLENGNTMFFGNFEELSHVFRIETNDPELIEKLTKAIKNNDGWRKYYHKNLAVNLMDLQEEAKRAFYWTSMSPDKRGLSMVKDYTDLLNYDLSKIKNASQEEKDRYISGFRNKFTVWLSAKSRCASSMVTGPANFPVEKNRKALDREHRLGIEMDEFREKAIKSILKSIDNKRPQEEKDAERWEAIEKNLLSTIQTIIDIDEGRNTYSARSLFTSSLTGFIQRMAKNGQVADVKKSLDLIEKLNESSKKEIITKRSKIWALREVVEQVSEKQEELKNAEDKEVLYDGFKVVISYSDERIRIIHDEKPDREVINNIKKHGFRWSPFNTAWQRKLTNNAIYVTFKILLKDEKHRENN